MAVLERLSGCHQSCVDFYERYIALNPYDYDVLNYLGLAQDELDKKEEAILNYKRAVSLKPDFYESLSNLGLSYQQE